MLFSLDCAPRRGQIRAPRRHRHSWPRWTTKERSRRTRGQGREPQAPYAERRQSSMPAVNEADPRVKRTRKLLQGALLDLLAEKSFDAITVQDIAERSTINRATFYAHYVDKYALFAGYVHQWFRRALRQHLADCAGLSRTNLHLVILASMEALAELDDHCRPTETMQPPVLSAVPEEFAALLLASPQPPST